MMLLLPLIVISGGAWFIQLCVNMSGLPLREAMQPETIGAVWSDTAFGRCWQVRSVMGLCAMIIAIALFLPLPRSLRSAAAWANFVVAAAIASSLAWAGHGQDGGGWHLLTDSVHLFAAGLWPMGLIPFSFCLYQFRRLSLPERHADIVSITRRFSLMSLCSVTLLAVSGIINGLFLIGSVGDLFGTQYGKVLLAKVLVFLMMMVVAAVNLLRLKPRLIDPTVKQTARDDALALQRNVSAELLLAAIVLVLTAILGLLAPGRG